MDARLAPSLAAGRLDRLAKPLEALSTVAPAGYADWTRIAHAGSAAAARDDAPQVRAACGACHQAYRARYRGEMRAAPLPCALEGRL